MIMSRLLQSHSGLITNFLQIPNHQPPYNPNKMGQAVSLATFGYVAASQIYHHLMTADSTIDVSGGIVQDPYEVAIDQMYPRFHSRMLMAKGAQDDPHRDWDAASMFDKIRANDVIRVTVYPNAENGKGNVKVVILDPSGTEYPRFYLLNQSDLEVFCSDMETNAIAKFNGEVFGRVPTADDGGESTWGIVAAGTKVDPHSAPSAKWMFDQIIKRPNVKQVTVYPFATTSEGNVACTTVGADGLDYTRFYILPGRKESEELLDQMDADEGFKLINDILHIKTFGKVISGKDEKIVVNA